MIYQRQTCSKLRWKSNQGRFYEKACQQKGSHFRQERLHTEERHQKGSQCRQERLYTEVCDLVSRRCMMYQCKTFSKLQAKSNQKIMLKPWFVTKLLNLTKQQLMKQRQQAEWMFSALTRKLQNKGLLTLNPTRQEG